MGGRGSSSGAGGGGAKSQSAATVKELGTIEVNNRQYKVYDSMPEGWRRIDAQNQPFGYVMIDNNKSRFSSERKTAFIKDKPIWKDATARRKIKKKIVK